MKIIISVMVIALSAIANAQHPTSQNTPQLPIINVNGEAIVKVDPDKIILTFGIETWDKDILLAKQKNNEILAKAMTILIKQGIEKKEIQTDHLSIHPRYKSDYRKEEFIGYFVRNSFVLTLTDTDKVESVVTEVLSSGVNHIHGISFQTTELKKHREKARDLALKAAKEKAEKMASALDRSIGLPTRINEGYNRSSWPSSWGRGSSSGMSQNVMQNISSESESPSDSIALGKISIKANVSVTFELK